MPFIQLQFRRGTASSWTSNNTILASGEMGIETDTDKFKIGDGATAWTSLTYGGLIGPEGPIGATGPTGATGEQGASGATGLTGATGIQGEQGASGATGLTGATGIQGETGATGIDGASGVTGLTGATGVDGLDGDKYHTYSDTSFTLASSGSETITLNDINVDYSAGQSIIVTNGGTNVQYGTVTNYNTSTAELTFDKIRFAGTAGNYSSWEVNLNGSVGIQGIQGASGVQGETGATGIQGVQGTQGASGSTGLTGDAGATGIQGASGSTGLTGATGVIGETGATGIQGLQGASGSTGLTGLTGATGIEGIQGIQGASGSTGLTGLTGATGIEGVQGASGSTGLTGLTGATGISGSTGPVGPSTTINATDDTADTSLFPVMVTDVGSVQTVKASSSKLAFNASTGILTTRVNANTLSETKVALSANNIDLSTGNYFTKTITALTTLTVSNVPNSGLGVAFILDLTNGGAFAITWWSGVKWANGTTPTLTASGRDSLGFFTHDGGTTWTGMVLGKALA